MIALDRILARIPKERHESILRVAHDLNIPPDSIDLTQAYLAVEAVSPLLDEMRKISADLPAAMKASGIEIVRGLSDKIAEQTTKQIADTGIAILRQRADEFFAASENQLSDTLTTFSDGCANALQSMQHRSDLAATRMSAAGDKGVSAAATIERETHHAGTILDRKIADLDERWWARTRAMVFVAVVVCGFGAGGAFFGGYERGHWDGYDHGAQVERAAHGWR